MKNDIREFFRRFVAVYTLLAPPTVLLLIPLMPLVPHQAIGIMAMLHGILFAPSLLANAAWFGPVTRRFSTPSKAVFLTLDDGPDPGATPEVLALLDRHGARACFMVIGRKVRQHPELARAVAAAGHELANHTDSHRERWFWSELWWGVRREIDACSRAIQDATGQRPRWFRPPVGMTNPYVHPVARSRGMRLLGWSARAKDAGAETDMEAAAARVLQAVRPGAIVVLHPEWKRPDGSFPGLRCLEIVLRELGAMGYRCLLPDDPRDRPGPDDPKSNP